MAQHVCIYEVWEAVRILTKLQPEDLQIWIKIQYSDLPNKLDSSVKMLHKVVVRCNQPIFFNLGILIMMAGEFRELKSNKGGGHEVGEI